MKKNHIKKIIAIPMLLLMTVLTVVLTTQTAYAATTLNKVRIEGYGGGNGVPNQVFEYESNDLLNFRWESLVDNYAMHVSKNGTDVGYAQSLFNMDTSLFEFNLTFTKTVQMLYGDGDYLTKNIKVVVSMEQFNATIHVNGKTIPALDIDSFTVQMLAPDNSKPIISGDIHNFVTNVDDPKPVEFFKGFLSATDDTDGDITDRIIIETDNYTANKKVLGSHKVIFAVSDTAGNKTTVETYVRVIDQTKPIISGSATTAEIGYKETWNVENFRKTLSVSDNHDTLTNTDIKLKTDGYTNNKTKLGTYNVIFTVKDTSNNEGTFTKPVKVIDNVLPTFSGPTKLTTSNKTILTESDVRKQLTADDEIDKNITARIKLVEDNYTGKGNKVGDYTIKYSVADNAGNTAYHTVTITRTDKVPPVIWIQDGVSIITDPTMPLTAEQIIDILRATGQVSTASTTKFTVLYDEYTGNEKTAGVYAYSVQARSENGNESIHNLSITVADNSDDGIITDGDFNFSEWFDANKTKVITGGVIAVAAVGLFFVFKKKKGKKRK